MKTTDQAVKRVSFVLFALLLHAFCAALAAGGLMRVYNMALAYERSNPEHAAKQVLVLFKESRYDEIIIKGDISLSEFESPNVFGNALETTGEGNYTLGRSGAEQWKILRGNTTIAELKLRVEKGGGGYGMDIWRAEKLNLISPAPKTYTVQAPAAVALTINGKSPHSRYLSQDHNSHSPFGDLPEELSPEAGQTYRLEGLYAPPSVAVQGKAGQLCEAVSFEDTVSVTVEPESQVVTQLSTLGEQAACAYAKYITNDATLNEVLPFFLPESGFYTHLKQFYNGWYNEHDAYAFSNAVFTNWRAYGERHISCDIAFDYWIKMGRHEYTYPSKYTMYFVLGNNGWRVSNLVVR